MSLSAGQTALRYFCRKEIDLRCVHSGRDPGSIFPLFQHLEIGRFYTLDKITQKVNWMNVREICWRVEGTIDYTLGLIQSWMRAV